MRAMADDAQKLVGSWRARGPSDNLVNVFADGHITMYLRKGGIGDLRTLEGSGRWRVTVC